MWQVVSGIATLSKVIAIAGRSPQSTRRRLDDRVVREPQLVVVEVLPDPLTRRGLDRDMCERLAKQPLHACPVHKQVLVGRHERRVPAPLLCMHDANARATARTRSRWGARWRTATAYAGDGERYRSEARPATGQRATSASRGRHRLSSSRDPQASTCEQMGGSRLVPPGRTGTLDIAAGNARHPPPRSGARSPAVAGCPGSLGNSGAPRRPAAESSRPGGGWLRSAVGLLMSRWRTSGTVSTWTRRSSRSSPTTS